MLDLLRTPTALAVADIRTDGGTQPRAGIDNSVVDDYADAMIDGAEFPSIIVYHDGAAYWLADGFHRLAAWKIANPGRPIPADVRQGDRREAVLHSVGANADHGLRRTNEDKRRAVMRLLGDGEWGQWSDREIARRCHVSHNFVSTLRRSLSSDDSDSTERTYTTRHGTTATMQTASIGKARLTDEEEKQIAIDWLSTYQDSWRTWRDLSDTQIHHANSPCYQAWVKAHPEIRDHKLRIKQAMYELRRRQAEQSVARAADADDNGWEHVQPHHFARPTAHCARCGRELTDPTAVAAGIGPCCARKPTGLSEDELDILHRNRTPDGRLADAIDHHISQLIDVLSTVRQQLKSVQAEAYALGLDSNLNTIVSLLHRLQHHVELRAEEGE